MSSKNVIDLRKKNRPAPPKKVPPRQDAPVHTRPLPLGRRVSPVRVRRRRLRIAAIAIILIIIAALVYGIHWASYLPRYSIETVTVAGAQQVDPSQIQQYVEATLNNGTHPFFSPDNIFLYNGKAITQALVANFPRIRSVQLSRASLFSNELIVTVTERQPLALWCSDASQTNCYQMDNTGFIFAPATAPAVALATSTSATSTTQALGQSLGEYVFYGELGTLSAASTSATSTDAASATDPSGSDATTTPTFMAASGNPIGQTFAGAHAAGMYALMQLLQQDGFVPESATVVSGSSFDVPLQTNLPAGGAGFYIKVSFGESSQQIVQDLQLVLASSALSGKQDQLEYIDLRFGDRVYYKLKDQTETQIHS